MLRSEVLSMGSELLSGDITDTNATYLARQFVALGIELRRVTQVGDSLQDIVAAMRSATENADLLVCTGGIGPTPDDLSREAVAELLGEQMRVSPELEATLRAWFGSRGRDMPEQNLKQATLIPSAEALHNRSGTAPGWWVKSGGKSIVLMPGVPHEMKTMWEEQVRPRLEGTSGVYIVSETLRTHGLGESTIAQMLGDILRSERPYVGTYAKADGVHVVITASEPDRSEAERRVREVAALVQQILGDSIWGTGPETLPMLVARLLLESGQTLSTQEEASGGRLAAELWATGSAAYSGGSVLGGQPPQADMCLRVGRAVESASEGRRLLGCEVTLHANGTRLDGATVQMASLNALPERATMAALHLVRKHLAGRE
ncbi:MAG: CinA family nicotinamide mononucleotide deamidase-related protein [Chloroflexota bacterium]|nr:CinA family nicotinamide mononucleotide deamidase-related protein [Chloroflexota bacterium]